MARAKTLCDLLDERATLTPDAPAFHERQDSGEWTTTSWAQFRQLVGSTTARLRRLNRPKGTTFLIVGGNALPWEVMQHAAWRAGFVVAAISPLETRAEIFQLIRRLRPGIIATDSPALLPPVSGATILPWKLDPLTPDFSTAAIADDPALIVLTSGSTGDPKILTYRHRQIRLAISAMEETLGKSPEGKRLLCWLPLANYFQRLVNLFAIAEGAQSFFVGNPRQIMEYIREVHPHHFTGVPRFYEKLHEGIERKTAWLPRATRPLLRYFPFAKVLGKNLEFGVSGSAPLAPAILERFRELGISLYEAYGVSECCFPLCMNTPHAHRAGTVGKPLPQIDIKISEEGEVLVASPGVCEEISPEPFVTIDGKRYYRTGDEGVMEGEYLRLIGRKSEIFKTSTGYKIIPHRIEQKILELPEIEHAVVLGAGKKAPVALCVLKDPKNTAIKNKILNHCQSLPHPQIPIDVVFVPAFTLGDELTSNLKLRRKRIAEKYAPEVDAAYAALDRPLAATK